MAKNTDVNLIIRAKDQAGKVLSSVAGTLGKVTAAAAAAGVAVATYFSGKMFVGGIKSAADFEEQMAKIQAVTGASAEEMAALEKAARDAGRTTTFTAKEAGEGLEILSRAGLSATDSIAALPEVLALAQGQSIGLAQAAGLVTDAVGIMGLSYEEAGRATDVLAKGATLANTTVDDLGAALSYAGGSAKAAGLTIEETVGILDALAESGLRGQRAGTALRNMLAQLEDPASNARKELAALGDESGDLGSALDTMAAAGDGASAAILAFGRESGPAVRALVGAGSAGIAEFTDQLNDAQGTAREAADVMTGPLNGAIKLLQSAWDSLTQYLTEPLLEPLTKEVKDLSSALSEAEESGRLEKLRNAIVETFEAGIEWVRQFASEIDINASVDTLSNGVANLGKTFASVKDAGTTTANVMAIAWNGLKVGVDALGATLASIGQGFAKVSLLAVQGLHAVGLASDDTVAKMEHLEGAAGAIRKGFEEDAAESAAKLNKALSNLGGSADEAGSKLNQAADDAKEATGKFAEVPEELRHVAEAADQLGLSWDNVTQSFIAGEPTIDQAIRQQQEMEQAVSDSARATNESADAQGRSAEATDKAAAAAEKMEAAFRALGVTSTAALADTARSAHDAFQTIKQGGAPVRDLESAFASYAQKAVDANNGVADSTLKAQAAQEGFKLSISETGEVAIQSFSSAQKAAMDLAASLAGGAGGGAGGEMDGLADSSDDAAGALDQAGSAMSQTGSIAQAIAGQIDAAKDAIAELSQEALDSAMAMEESSDNWFRWTEQVAAMDASKFAGPISEVNKLEAELADFQRQAAEAAEEAAYLQNALNWPGLGWAKFKEGVGNLWKFTEALAEAKVRATELQIEQQALADAAEAGTVSLAEQADTLRRLERSYGDLNDSSLESLRDQIRGVNDELMEMEERSEETLRRLREQIAEAEGDFSRAEEIRNAEKLLDLEKQLTEAEAAGSREATLRLREAIKLQERLNKSALEEAKIREREAKEDRREERATTRAAGGGPGTTPVRTVRFEDRSGTGFEVPEDQEDQVMAFVDQLARGKRIAR